MRIQEFEYSIDLGQIILWQYNIARKIQALLAAKQAWYDMNQTAFWADWYTNVFNLETADAFGLSVWSIILDQPLTLGLPPDPIGKPIFGFSSLPWLNDNQNFHNANFSNGGAGIGLTLSEQRIVLQLKYFKLITRGAAPEINAFLKIIFNAFGTVYMLDGLNMTIRYVFTFQPSPALAIFLDTFDLLPRPAGVGLSIVVVSDTVFGFSILPWLNNNQNFHNANFSPWEP